MLSWIKSHKLIIAIALALAVGLYFYVSRNNNVSYQEYQVKTGAISENLELSGKIQAGSQATLRFPAGGYVTYVGAKEGDEVKKWSTLASLDTRQLQKTLEQKLNLYSIQRGTFDQTIDDNDNSVPDGDLSRELKRLLEKNQFQLDNTVKDVEYLDLSLKLSRLTTPLAGILVSSPTDNAGVQVLPTDSWIVIDPTSLYFSADLDETDLDRVTVGQKVEITLDAFPDQSYESVVSNIAYVPKETTSGTVYELKLALSGDALANLRLGLNGTAKIILTEKASVNLLPSSAVTFTGNETSVLKKQDNKYESVKITTGIENEGQIEVLSGLSEGEYVYVQTN